ncbi:MAG: glutaredoxin domain-containing protein [Pseudomonas sp.]
MLSTYTIYTMPNCPHCVSAKELFKREGITFSERSADPKAENPFTREELIAHVGPVRTLPQIILKNGEGEFHIGGYTDLLAYRKGEKLDLRKIA